MIKLPPVRQQSGCWPFRDAGSTAAARVRARASPESAGEKHCAGTASASGQCPIFALWLVAAFNAITRDVTIDAKFEGDIPSDYLGPSPADMPEAGMLSPAGVSIMQQA